MTTPDERSELPPSSAEFDETWRKTSPQDRARELFVHALLETQSRAHRAADAADVQRVLDHLDSARAATATAPVSLARTRTGSLRRFSWLAAAALLLGLAITMWSQRDATPAYADEIFESALAKAASSTHVYDVEMRFRKSGGRLRVMKLELALASGSRFHAKISKGGRLLADGAEFGSDGKVVWGRGRGRASEAFELAVHQPDKFAWGGLGAELPYYELRPFLEARLGELDLKVSERKNGVAVLRGDYETKGMRSTPMWHHASRRWKRIATEYTTRGELRVHVDESSGQLMYIRRTVNSERRHERRSKSRMRRFGRHYHYPELESFELRRREGASAEGFEFDPPRMRATPFWQHVSFWGRLGRTIRSSMRRNRALDNKSRDGSAPRKR